MSETITPFTSEDADRLLGLGDEMLDQWADEALKNGRRDTEYEERVDEWQHYRPLFEQAPNLYTGLKRAIVALNSQPNFKTHEGIKSYTLLSQLDGIIAKVPERQPPEELTNAARARFAANALDTYGQKKEGDFQYDATEDMAADLMCDLMHLIRVKGGDPLQKMRVAQSNFEAELSEESARQSLPQPKAG